MKISVIVTSFNHEKYITQCLQSILSQKGDFELEVIIGDDSSVDNTRAIAQQFQQKSPEIITLLPRQPNLGITKNLKRCLNACAGDYIAICEGDDYWTDDFKLQKQMTFLETHQNYSMCFNAIMIYYEDTNIFQPFQSQLLLKKDTLFTEDLILDNSIGNFSCCMYRTKVVKQLPDQLFDLFTVDWMFNMVCGQFGPIGFIRDWMSVYRKHAYGAWASKTKVEVLTELDTLIDEYNQFFNYAYNTYFLKFKEGVNSDLSNLQTSAGVERFVEPEFVHDELLRSRMRALQIEMAQAQQTVQALLAERDEREQALFAERAETKQIIAEREQIIEEKEQAIDNLKTKMAENENWYLSVLAEKDNIINAIYQSTSWKITQPLREAKSAARLMVRQIGGLILRILPISQEKKQNLRTRFFNRFGPSRPALTEAKTANAASDNNSQKSTTSTISSQDIKKLIEQKKTTEFSTIPENREETKVSVVVISYNQEQYITECLDGIFTQQGNFAIELIIGDDCSTDTTLAVIKNYIEHHIRDDIRVKILDTDQNIGMTKNLQRCFDACNGEFIAVCEGDDYWFDAAKLQKQVDFLKSHPECSLCFHDIYLYYQDRDEFYPFELQSRLDTPIIKTRDLVLDYYIGNLSSCMYDAKYMKQIPADLFDLYIGDWMFNIYYSRFGDIGHLKDEMSVYRKHNQGVWAGKALEDQGSYLHDRIGEYNEFLNYEFDSEFSAVRKRIEIEYPSKFNNEPLELAIVDDAFPHPHSAFRMQEFSSYLEHFHPMKIYPSGISLAWLGKKTLDELISDFKRRYPEYDEKIEKFALDTPINTKLFYFVFLGNTFINVEKVEKLNTPFVFTLYPGGAFALNDSRSDSMLKRVTASPCFRKVIVTQKITYDYLIQKQFCVPDQIEFIFGVVTPLEQIEAPYQAKQRFGRNKDTLDICFVAHKYTETGIDKGYDVFVAVATVLSERYPNIQFHVVGGFDESVLEVRHLNQRIKFYGSHEIEWFDEFYKDKDIILSPNIPFKVLSGAFDGFPTGSCVDAGLREVAIFCTDELKLNTNFFVDGEEIVIIPHDVYEISATIESFYHNPERLITIAQNGRDKIKKLYSYEAQILPRINILKEQIGLSESKKETRGKNASLHFRRNHASKLIADILSKANHNSPVWLKEILKRMLPGFVKKIYYRLLIEI